MNEEDNNDIHEDRRWRADGWTAQVIKNEDDEGWAVAMTRAGEAEPALVGPWTMGRDKKNPKPLDAPAFHTLVKTASEVLRRHEQQLHAQLHKSVSVDTVSTRVAVGSVLALAAVPRTRKSAPNHTGFPGTSARPVASPPRQKDHQISRFLGIPEKRLARRAHLRAHRQTLGKVDDLARTRGYGKVSRDFPSADPVPETTLH